MKRDDEDQTSRSGNWTVVSVAAALLMCVVALPVAHSQTYTVLHNFTDGGDGAIPMAGLTMDAAGNFYGTTQYGGNTHCNLGCGTVFKLTHQGSSWVLTTLYQFTGGAEGSGPIARVVFGPDGALYGTANGGAYPGACCGSVFRLTPPATFCRSVICPWNITILHQFSGGYDGGSPGYGDLIFDAAGNIYGTTEMGGPASLICPGGCGVVFELVKASGWALSGLYRFTGQADGATPAGGVVFDASGDLLGTTLYGGYIDLPDGFLGAGVIFKLTHNGSSWTESVPYMFQDSSGDGGLPYASLTVGPSGTIYGTTASGGGGNCNFELYSGCGTVFESFGRTDFGFFPNVNLAESYISGPFAPVTFDPAGHMNGTTWGDGENGPGNVFQLTYFEGNWVYSSLYDFSGGSDGGFPASNVITDSHGNYYGTASAGGSQNTCTIPNRPGCGVIWEITP
jgi:hypothetical protein